MLHVLINADVWQTIFVIKRSRTKLVDIAVVVPQDAFQCQRLTSTGGFDHVHWQKHSAVKSWLLHINFSLLWIVSLFATRSAPLFCAVGRRCGTFLQYDQSHRLSAPTHNTGSKCFAPVPAGWQRHRPPVRPGYAGYSHRL